MEIKDIATKELERELRKRNDRTPRYCPKCRGKWTTYLAFVSFRGDVDHCHGCRKPVENCTC